MNHPRNTRRAILDTMLSGVGLHPKRYLFRDPQPHLLAQFGEHVVTRWLENWSKTKDRPSYLQRLAALHFANELCTFLALGLQHDGQKSLPILYKHFRESWFLAEPDMLVNLHIDLVHRLVRKHAHGATAVIQEVAQKLLAAARGQGEPLSVALESGAAFFDAHIEAATAVCVHAGMIDHYVRVSASR